MRQSVSFGRHRFDLETGVLWCDKREIKLTPKASAVLKMLVTHAGEPVHKDELFASVWNGTIVSDDALTSCVQELRKALADDAKQPRFIETRHRRGYRFIAQLSTPGDLDLDRDALLTQPAIAVFSFEDLSEIADRAHFADGITQDIITALSCWRRFPVIAHNSTWLSKAKHDDSAAAARELGARYFLQGSVRRAGTKIRICVQLVDASSGRRFGRAGTIGISGTCLPCKTRSRVASSRASCLSSVVGNSIARCVSIRRVSTAGITRSAPCHASTERCRTSTHSPGRMPSRPATCCKRQSTLTLPRLTRIRCWRSHTSMTPWRTGQKIRRAPSQRHSKRAPCGRTRRRGLAVSRAVRYCHSLDQPQPRQSLEEIERAITLNHSAAIAYQFQGCAALFAGRPTQAVTALETVSAPGSSVPVAIADPGRPVSRAPSAWRRR